MDQVWSAPMIVGTLKTLITVAAAVLAVRPLVKVRELAATLLEIENCVERVPVVPKVKLPIDRLSVNWSTLAEPVVSAMITLSPSVGMPGDQLTELVQKLLVLPFQVEVAACRLVAAANSKAATLTGEVFM